MTMRALALSLAAAFAAVASSTALAAPAATKLTGTVGPGFTITLKGPTGKVVKTLRPGAYTLTVGDKADIHDFHITGPGVNKKTSVSGTGTTTWKIVLKTGKYRYQCDPHASSMKGNFTVA
jgi:plastocyanin